MKSTIIITILIAASPALGAKWTQKRREAREARKVPGPFRTHSHSPNKQLDGPFVNLKHEADLANNTHIAYSENWTGAVLVSSSFTSVTGTIIVPTPTSADDGKESAGAAWVGIDGDTCTTAILQTGIDWYIQDGHVAYDAWYEWYPDYSYTFPASSIRLSAGDALRLTVTATSPSAGSATIENLTTGKRAAHTFSNGKNDGVLCGANAEWIVEDFQSCDANGNCGLVPFADFGSLAFTNCSAVQGGKVVTPGTAGEGLIVIDIYQKGEVLADCSVSGGTVKCTYEQRVAMASG